MSKKHKARGKASKPKRSEGLKPNAHENRGDLSDVDIAGFMMDDFDLLGSTDFDDDDEDFDPTMSGPSIDELSLQIDMKIQELEIDELITTAEKKGDISVERSDSGRVLAIHMAGCTKSAFEKLTREIEDHYKELHTLKEKLCSSKMNGGNTEADVEDNQNAEFDPSFSRSAPNRHEAERSPIIRLAIPNRDTGSAITSMDGTFHTAEIGMTFKAKINDGTEVALYVEDGPRAELESLFQVLCKEDYNVRVVGNSEPSHFIVQGLHLIDTSVSDGGLLGRLNHSLGRSEIEDAHFQLMLDRLLNMPTTGALLTADNISPTFLTKNDILTLYNVCKLTYPPTIQKWAEHNISCLNSPHAGNDEKRHALTALSYVLNIDWTIRVPNIPTLEAVRAELDRRFWGLEKVKERILEVAAQIRHTQHLPFWGILLHGPAGVGKTSIAKAIAEVLGMPISSLDFSSIKDSESLTGSSRIYNNARPGHIVEQIFFHRTINMVMVLNEIDKASGNVGRGNPADVLLSLVDGQGFSDTYLEVTIPTQGIFFVATCNNLNTISKPILDRFYRIDVPAYTPKEKKVIFERYVLPTAMKRADVNPTAISLTGEAVDKLVNAYATEAGIRDLEQYAEKMLSHYLLEKELTGHDRVKYDTDDIFRLFGAPRCIDTYPIAMPGMVHSAFVDEGCVGIIDVQALLTEGTGSLRLVNVDNPYQREYCRMAYEFMRSQYPSLDSVDVVISINKTLHLASHNFLGFAVCAAIISATNMHRYSSRTLFIGGCDLMGTIYLDENDLSLLLHQVEGRYDPICTAVGAREQIVEKCVESNISIIELPNVQSLAELGTLDLQNLSG